MPYSIDRHELFGGGIYRLTSPNNPEFPQDSVWDAYNMVYGLSSQDLEKMMGYVQLGTNGVNGAVEGLFDYADGTEMIAASADGGIYNRTTGDWAAVTGGAAATFSTTAGVRWSGSMFYGATTSANLLILTNSAAGDAPQKYTAAAGISALGGSPPAAGQYPVPFGGRLWMVSGDTLFYSAADNSEDWTTNGGSFQCDRGTGNITGLYNFAGHLIIFKRRKILRLLPGTTLASTSIRDVSAVLGTSSHYTISETTGSFRSGTLFFRSDEGIHELVPTPATGGFFVRNASDYIKPIIDRADTANLGTNWALFNPARGEYWLQQTLNSASPDEGVIGNVAARTTRWTYHDMRGKTTGTMFNSSGARIQIVGDSSGNVYQMHSGHTRAGASFRGFMTTASFTQGDRSRMKIYGRIFLDAQTNGTYPIIISTTLGRADLTSPRGETDQLSGFGAVDGWGVGTWGVAVWGGSHSTGKWYRLTDVRRGSFIRHRIETLGGDQWFRVNGLNQEYSLRRHVLAA